MNIGGFDKVTLLNYPDNVACTIFTIGCNFKCPFCHNSSLIINNKSSIIDEQYIFDYLEKRKNLLDGVCISGGEPLIQKDIIEFVNKIKNLGYKVKIDTNGSKPDVLKKLIDQNLVDYVAMDIKNTFDKYEITICKKTNIDNIKKSMDILKESNIDYEFRTTLVKEYHNINDIKEICKLLDTKSKYYLQNFVSNEEVLNKNLHGFSIDELKEIEKELKKDYPNVMFRDI